MLKSLAAAFVVLGTRIGSAALFDYFFMSRKTSENCGRDFLIVEGVPMTEEQYSRKGSA